MMMDFFWSTVPRVSRERGISGTVYVIFLPDVKIQHFFLPPYTQNDNSTENISSEAYRYRCLTFFVFVKYKIWDIFLNFQIVSKEKLVPGLDSLVKNQIPTAKYKSSNSRRVNSE